MASVFGVDGSYRVGPSPFLAGNECRGSPMEQNSGRSSSLHLKSIERMKANADSL